MAKNHGARQQKRVAKQKAKRSAKRSLLNRRTSKDPTTRLQGAGKWPVVKTLMGTSLWKEGLGSLVIARQEPAGQLVFAVFLVDVYCLGVKNAFWHAGSPGDLQEMLAKMEKTRKLTAITPACLVKIVKGAIEYAQSFGFPPHHDYRHASALLEGIDPATSPNEFTFGRDGKPFYVQGPNETPAQAKAITERILEAGGHYLVALSGADAEELSVIEDDFDEFDPLDEDDESDESL